MLSLETVSCLKSQDSLETVFWCLDLGLGDVVLVKSARQSDKRHTVTTEDKTDHSGVK